MEQTVREQLLDIIKEGFQKAQNGTYTQHCHQTIASADGYTAAEMIEEIEKLSKEHNVDPKDIHISSDSYTLEVEFYIEVQSELSPDAKKIAIRERFNKRLFFSKIYKFMTEHGYKRVGFGSDKLKEFENENSIYDRMVREDYDGVIKYFMLFFEKA